MVELRRFVSEALALSKPLGQCPDRASRVRKLPEGRFHHCLTSFFHILQLDQASSRGAPFYCTRQRGLVLPCDRHDGSSRSTHEKTLLYYMRFMFNSLSKRALNASSGWSLNFWKSMLKKGIRCTQSLFRHLSETIRVDNRTYLILERLALFLLESTPQGQAIELGPNQRVNRCVRLAG